MVSCLQAAPICFVGAWSRSWARPLRNKPTGIVTSGLESPAMNSLPQVGIILPCHNEATSVAAVIEACGRALSSRPHEIIVVDDGSTDETASVARKAGASVVRLDPNCGKGVALRHGVQAAQSSILIFLDADGQDDPADIPELLAALTPRVKLVVGSRFLGTLHRGAIRPMNRVANLAFTALISGLFGQRITDSQAGFRVVRRQDYLDLKVGAEEYDVETEMLLKAIKSGWQILELPVSRFPRRGSHTDFNRVRHGLLILWTIVRERARS